MHSVAEYIQLLAVPGAGVVLLALFFTVARHFVMKVGDERLRALLLELVKAAEQIYGPGKGVAKLRYVQEQAQRRGLPRVSRDAIEAAVYDLSRATQ